MRTIEPLFNPKSIAIVGVSQTPEKLGSVIYNNLLNSGYKGHIYLVNPKYKTLYGKKVFSSLSKIPRNVDLVCIAIPATLVKDVIKDAGKKNVSAAIIISAGFRETGEKGLLLEKELIDEAGKFNIRILGPNCLGVMSSIASMNASFAAANTLPGDVAFLSQSGAFCTAILDMSLEKNLGFSHFVSVVNKSDINENEIIDFWLNDPNVKVIGGYLEEISDGQKLLEVIKKGGQTKPTIISTNYDILIDDALAEISSYCYGAKIRHSMYLPAEYPPLFGENAEFYSQGFNRPNVDTQINLNKEWVQL